MRSLLFSAVAAFLALSFAIRSDEKPYPKDYFGSPVDPVIRLSGTFGELRPNHFHSGIDIKGSVGQTLYAAADGYVSRIRVQKDGYGKVIYLSHPNGYTTVYAHMNNFTPQLEQYMKTHQYDREKFELELFPEKDQFTFKKGEKIGAMGVSGSSFGPHVHFEIRDSKTEKPINPLLFGLAVADSRAPRVHALRVYQLNDKLETIDASSYDLVRKGDHYSVKDEVLTIGAWRAGFGLKVYDHLDGAPNWNGIYALQTFVNDELVYEFELEDFSFSESRYLNAHLDYEEQVTNKSYFNRCYRLPGNRLSIYGKRVNEGVVPLYEEQPSKVTIVASDVAGNTSTVEFWVKRGPVEKKPPKVFKYILPYDEENVVDVGDMQVHFPKGALYETLYMDYSATEDPSSGTYSAVHSIHNFTVPVHRNFDLAIRPTVLPKNLRDKAFIGYCERDNKVTNFGGRWKNGMLTTRVRKLGDYCIMIDNTPPVIKPVHFNANMKGYNRMTFLISDNIPSGGMAKGLTYRATVDGEWILMEYDEKNDELNYRFDGRLDPGTHQLKLVVSDSQHNTTVFEGTFSR